MGTASAVTSLANGVYTLSDRIIKSTDTGVADIKRLIEGEDLKNRIKIMGMFVKEINVSDDTPVTIEIAVDGIKLAIRDIELELKKIQHRIDYNDSLVFSAGGTRYYKFGNSYKRLDAKIKTLNTRFKTLCEMHEMRHLMNRTDMVIQADQKQIMFSGIDIVDDEKIVNKILTYEGDEYGVNESGDDLNNSIEAEIKKSTQTE